MRECVHKIAHDRAEAERRVGEHARVVQAADRCDRHTGLSAHRQHTRHTIGLDLQHIARRRLAEGRDDGIGVDHRQSQVRADGPRRGRVQAQARVRERADEHLADGAEQPAIGHIVCAASVAIGDERRDKASRGGPGV